MYMYSTIDVIQYAEQQNTSKGFWNREYLWKWTKIVFKIYSQITIMYLCHLWFKAEPDLITFHIILYHNLITR